MRAFVTGGTGFVGSHLVEGLLADGHDVTSLIRSPAKAARVFTGRRPGLLEGDLDDRDALARGAASADVIFHVAAVTAARDRDEFFAVNAGATRRLVDVAREHAALRRFVLISSLAAGGPAARGRPRTEEDPDRPVTPYGESKRAAEDALRESPLPWTIVRPPTVYGPRDAELLRVFRLARRGIVPVFGDGTQELSLIYVRDLARALLAVLATPPGRLFHAAHPEVVTSRDLVRAVHRAVRPDATRGPAVIGIPGAVARAALWVTGTAARLAGRATLLAPDKAAEFLAPAWTCTAERLTSETGWQADIPLAEGLERTATWYRDHGWL